MKKNLFSFVTLSLLLSKFVFAENCVTDPKSSIQTCIADQSSRYIAGVETFKKYHSGDGISYNTWAPLETAAMNITGVVYKPLPDLDIWTNYTYPVDKSTYPLNTIQSNTPFVQIPTEAGISIIKPAAINAIFTYFAEIFSPSNANILSFEIWGSSSQNQPATLIAQKILTGNDFIQINGASLASKHTNTTLPAQDRSVDNILSCIDITCPGAGSGIDTELLQTSTSGPLYNVSARIVPLYPDSDNQQIFEAYSIELDVLW